MRDYKTILNRKLHDLFPDEVYVFTPQGKHVTSVVMQGAAIERRRHQGRWRLAEPEERGEFRIQIKRLVAAGEDTPRESDAEDLPQGGG